MAHEEGNLNDIRAILGNDTGIEAYRERTLPLLPATSRAKQTISSLPVTHLDIIRSLRQRRAPRWTRSRNN